MNSSRKAVIVGLTPRSAPFGLARRCARKKRNSFTFLTLQSCLEYILLCHSRNNYNIPHAGKEALQRQGLLPIQLEAMEQAMNLQLHSWRLMVEMWR